MVNILITVGMAIGLGLYQYISKWQKGQPFEIIKLLQSGLVGLGLGAVCLLKDCQVTAENWDVLLATYGIVIVLVDKAITVIRNLIKKPV